MIWYKCVVAKRKPNERRYNNNNENNEMKPLLLDTHTHTTVAAPMGRQRDE